MKKKLKEYMRYDYPVRIVKEPDGLYCAEVADISGLCAYGKTPTKALRELDEVKEAEFELMLSQGQEPPVPKIKLEIPENIFKRMRNKNELKQFVKV
ncbi:MAG: type II toxin-antitoxin system HicB family antitoxin [Ignavibacteriae bacterium]|nr:type II toxin-antitoxin system HicB family antitoxin [Ignavibacteriota bacterium]